MLLMSEWSIPRLTSRTDSPLLVSNIRMQVPLADAVAKRVASPLRFMPHPVLLPSNSLKEQPILTKIRRGLSLRMMTGSYTDWSEPQPAVSSDAPKARGRAKEAMEARAKEQDPREEVSSVVATIG